jgi:hypothetical protein
VTFRDGDEPAEQCQPKHSIKGQARLGDTSTDVWKTIHHWTNEANRQRRSLGVGDDGLELDPQPLRRGGGPEAGLPPKGHPLKQAALARLLRRRECPHGTEGDRGELARCPQALRRRLLPLSPPMRCLLTILAALLRVAAEGCGGGLHLIGAALRAEAA